MTDKKAIGTIAHLGFVWGLEELRTTLKTDEDSNETNLTTDNKAPRDAFFH